MVNSGKEENRVVLEDTPGVRIYSRSHGSDIEDDNYSEGGEGQLI